ncbi:MAG: flavin reductase family protein [Planctomycetota bacterium]
MKTHEIELTKDLPETIERMRTDGLLLTSVGADGRPNVMTIGWGNPGIIWGRPIFTVYVRPSRYTFGNIQQTGQFAVCVPTADMGDECMLCGSKSGRDTDKFAEAGLTAAEAQTVDAPLIEQCLRFYECRVVSVGDVVDAAVDAEIRKGCYPEGDFHRIYFGRVLRASERVE